MDDAAGFVGFDVVAVEDPFEGGASVYDVAVGVRRDVAESEVVVDADGVFGLCVRSRLANWWWTGWGSPVNE